MSPQTVTGHFYRRSAIGGGGRCHLSVSGEDVRRVVHWTLLEELRVPRRETGHVNNLFRDKAHATPRVGGGEKARCSDRSAGAGGAGRRGPTFSQSLWTSISGSCLQAIRPSIQPSRVGTVVGSRVTADVSSAGARPTSSMLVSIVAIASRGWGPRGCCAAGSASRRRWSGEEAGGDAGEQ